MNSAGQKRLNVFEEQHEIKMDSERQKRYEGSVAVPVLLGPS